MAKATATHTSTTFTLELDEQEAQYVFEALRKSHPAHLEGDPVWDALGAAMHEAGVVSDDTALEFYE